MQEGNQQLEIEKGQLYRLLFEHANDGIFMYELLPDGTPGPFLAVNELASRRLGYSKEELRRMTFNAIGQAGDNKEKLQEFWARLQTTGYGSFETIHVTKNGTYIPV